MTDYELIRDSLASNRNVISYSLDSIRYVINDSLASNRHVLVVLEFMHTTNFMSSKQVQTAHIAHLISLYLIFQS